MPCLRSSNESKSTKSSNLARWEALAVVMTANCYPCAFKSYLFD
jgi:hypothetical protein